MEVCAWSPARFNACKVLSGRHLGRLNIAQPVLRPPVRSPGLKSCLQLRCHYDARSQVWAPINGQRLGDSCPFDGSIRDASVPDFQPTTTFRAATSRSFEVGREWRNGELETPLQGRAAVRESVEQSPGIPGPQPWNFFENAVDLSYIARYGIEEAVLHYSQKYGPLCRFSNAFTAWTFVNDPAIIQHICVTNSKNYSRRYLPAIYEYVTQGKGILGSQGSYNRQHRKMCAPPFKTALQLRKFTNTVADKAAAVASALHSHAARGPVVGNMATHMQRLTLDIVGEVAFSKDFGQIARITEDMAGSASGADMSRDRLLHAVNVSQECMGNVFITPLSILRLLKRMGEPGMSKMDRAFDEMRSIMTKVIQERREAWSASGSPGDDLLGVLLAAEDESGGRLTDEELWEDVHDIMGAGHETTASTTTAALYCISQTPGVEEKVVAELHSVLRGRVPTYDDLPRLQYTSAVVKEVLRLYPAIPLFPRTVDQDDVLPTGHKIPAGDVVFMSTYAMGRNADVWEDPETFNPDRFHPDEEARRHKFAWVQFGAGPRMCLGANFAMMSVTQVVATLVQAFHFEAVRPQGKKLPFAYDITINFPGGIVMEAVPRAELRMES